MTLRRLLSCLLFRADLAEEINHLDGTEGGIGALVARLGAGTLDGLFNGVGGKETEADRDAGLQRDLGQSFGCLVSDIHVMAGLSTDDATEADDGVVTSCLGKSLGGHRQFPGTRHPNLVDVLIGGVVPKEGIARPGKEP